VEIFRNRKIVSQSAFVAGIGVFIPAFFAVLLTFNRKIEFVLWPERGYSWPYADWWLVSLVGLVLALIYAMRRLRHEIAGRRRAEERLDLAANVFEHSLNAIAIADAQQNIIDINPAYTHMFGYTKEELIGKRLGAHMVELGGANDRDELQYPASAQVAKELEVHGHGKNGEIYDGLASVSHIKDKSGNHQFSVNVVVDISAQKKYESQLERMAYYDALTGLPNRLLMTQLIEGAIAQDRSGGNAIAVCYLDLDDFQWINDNYSQQVGDQVLVAIAERLQTILPSTDALAHLGGDEFALMLVDLANTQHCLRRRLDDVLAALHAPIAASGFSLTVSASIGVTFYPHDLSRADRLVRHANQAMHQAKQNGKNRMHIFNIDHERNVQQRHSALFRLREALDNEEFVLYYQPKVDLVDRRVVGAEALIRWLHPQQGLVAPGAFLPALEGTDLDVLVGDWVIETALQQIETWLHTNAMCIPVSVNISAKHLLQANFSERLHMALSRHPEVPVHGLELEVVETAALDDFEAAKRTMLECKKLGVRFALDDFGTGYSSLAYFQRLPIDVLKIDQSFVRNIHENRADLEITESIVKLAQLFNRAVVAEGVETAEHIALLQRIGCRYGQGYGMARPMPASKLYDWVRRWEASLCDEFNSRVR